ncbi:hypothetical protein MVES_001422 [Malassezia vespertilionis]|uniref:N-acetyltransferase domain-containing protein n=2 Tax=Malassezia vespertilionis TaxID=2020962 RepID=A0A2N1JCJ0_9BASI|nr:hypothetical protein MVES_001422 [Malassezia vespertilionis]
MAPTWPAMEYAERSKPQGSASVRSHIAERANISMADITPNNVGQLHMLNAKLFPIVYVKELYKVQGEDVKPLCKLGLFNDIPVGDICCTLEDGPDETTWKIYIMTLGVLPSYRRLGIATALLNHVLENAPVGGMFAGRR